MAHSHCPLCGTKLIGQQQFARRCPQCQGSILRYDQEVEEEKRRQRHREEMEAERIRQNSFSYKLTSLITSIIGGTVKLTLYIGIIIGGILFIGWLTASPEQKAMVAPPTKQTTPAALTGQKPIKATNKTETTHAPTENIEQITEEVIQPTTIVEEETEDPILEEPEEPQILSETTPAEKDPKQQRAFRKAMKKQTKERERNNRREKKRKEKEQLQH